jgi:hypothetical protein
LACYMFCYYRHLFKSTHSRSLTLFIHPTSFHVIFILFFITLGNKVKVLKYRELDPLWNAKSGPPTGYSVQPTSMRHLLWFPVLRLNNSNTWIQAWIYAWAKWANARSPGFWRGPADHYFFYQFLLHGLILYWVNLLTSCRYLSFCAFTAFWGIFTFKFKIDL